MVRRVFLGAGIIGAVATAVAFRTFFARPGENALRLIPQDAIVFGTIDLTPSPTQALVFKELDEALSRNGLDKKLDGALTDLLAQGSVADQLRPYSKRGAAFAMLAPKGSGEFDLDEAIVGYFPISDPQEVSKIIRKNGKPFFWRGTPYYKLTANGPGMMVMDDMIVVSSSGKALNRVHLVLAQKEPSMLERPDFIAEREKIDSDSNLMVFATPEAFKVFSKDAPKEAKGFFDSYRWLAMGIALRDGGIALSFNGNYDAGKAPWLKSMANISPIRQDLMAVLPSGAYSVNAISQPTGYFEAFEASMKELPEGRKFVREMESELPKETGISLRQDILPAFKGNSVLAVYPSEAAGKVAGIDLLAVIDDQNGATAGALAERVREFVEREIGEEVDGSPFEVSTEGNVKKYRLTGEIEDELQQGFEEGLGDSSFDRNAMFKDKTITWAIVGNTVVISTSAKLLDRTLTGLKEQKNGLNTDALWATTAQPLLADTQTLVAFNLSRIAEGFENTAHIDKMGDDAKTVQEIVNALKGLKEPLSITSATSEDAVKMRWFIPMDYTRLIDLIGQATSKE